ncbi:hypothetical protein DY052_06275 [Apilactobacillus timberlakei]|uniref:hypothetical protein n=1 Tax=Apilactobacillus timberlakei TaxID=2008380 RepID=UPI00112B15CB|nr:hypothetical protein [Apilactobacillus timberlakei]TPR15030.1 hypothetical protein DY052_06275 [Apilactobacillus timberlakei]
MIKGMLLENLYSEKQINVKFIKLYAVDIMDEWNEDGLDYCLDYMNEMVHHLYKTGELEVEDSEDSEEVFEDMIALDTLYKVQKDSPLYLYIKEIAKNHNKQINMYLHNFIDYDDDSIICTDIIIKNQSFNEYRYLYE